MHFHSRLKDIEQFPDGWDLLNCTRKTWFKAVSLNSGGTNFLLVHPIFIARKQNKIGKWKIPVGSRLKHAFAKRKFLVFVFFATKIKFDRNFGKNV